MTAELSCDWPDSARRGLVRLVTEIPNLVLWLTGFGLWIYLIVPAFKSSLWGIDLEVFRGASRSLREGMNPYNLSFTFVHLPLTYPPSSLLLLFPIGYLSKTVCELFWMMSNVVITTQVLRKAMREVIHVDRSKAIAVSFAAGAFLTCILQPLRSNFGFGQVNFIILLLVLTDCMNSKWRLRGSLVGVAAALKLIPLGFILFFFIQKDFRAICRTAVTFMALSVFSWIILPREFVDYWFSIVFSPARAGGLRSVHNQSLDGMLHRLMQSGLALNIVWVSAVGLTLTLAVLLGRHLLAHDRSLEAFVVIAISIDLSSPISWSHHWVEVSLLPWLVISEIRDKKVVASALLFVLFAALFTPSHWWPHNPVSTVKSFPLVLAALLCLVTWVLYELWRAHHGGEERSLDSGVG